MQKNPTSQQTRHTSTLHAATLLALQSVCKTTKRTYFSVKRALHQFKRALYPSKRDIHSLCMQTLCLLCSLCARLPKETYISVEDSYINAQKPISQQKSPTFFVKRPVAYPKSPMSPSKKPCIFLYKALFLTIHFDMLNLKIVSNAKQGALYPI